MVEQPLNIPKCDWGSLDPLDQDRVATTRLRMQQEYGEAAISTDTAAWVVQKLDERPWIGGKPGQRWVRDSQGAAVAVIVPKQETEQ